jgi:hypothetical protein
LAPFSQGTVIWDESQALSEETPISISSNQHKTQLHSMRDLSQNRLPIHSGGEML